ncbi:MAG TPA: stage V sporulation T C-terminal domain-containing protein [Clostridia bacterium]|nr:stage V sporulation T C-terminal domain-containing protein [Clostridia bacterium]
MQTTGIVRRIDELGRIVIPKEIRRTMRLSEGDEMEICVADGMLTLKKFSEIENMREYAGDIVMTLRDFTSAEVMLVDLSTIVLYEGGMKKKTQGLGISHELESILRGREFKLLTGKERIPLYENDQLEFKSQIVSPIVAQGDVVGGLVMLTNNNGQELSGYVNLAVQILVPICTK